MTPALAGASLGALFAMGLLVAIRSAPPMRPVRLVDRIGPYLGGVGTPSRLLATPESSGGAVATARRLVGPVLGDLVRGIDRIVGGAASVRRRLSALNSTGTVEEFRVEQLVWGCCGLAGAVLLLIVVAVFSGGVDPLVAAALAAGGLIGGVLARDWSLSRSLARREQSILSQFPVAADLIALAVTAGEAVPQALARVCRLVGGELAHDLQDVLARSNTGTPLPTALRELAARTSIEALRRFLVGVAVALERGTPLAEVLRAQAGDVRAAGTRALLEAGGRKEVSMMVPVVFLILPVTVLFALYPGLLTLTSLAR